ncbi:MAG: tetratricopeptide repeat protein, partial [Phormidesmis sp.]
MPVSNVSKFVGREQDLAAVVALLSQNSRVNIAAAVGMGGVGKTELAWQYARRYGNEFPGGVCWLRGVEPIAPQMISFARDYLDLPVPEQTESPMAWCAQRWPGKGAVLMVVDDVQDYGALKAMLPSGGMGDGRFRVLLTTRQAILPEGQRLPLKVLLPAAALELLANLAGADRVEAERAAAVKACEWVGRLPLGIELMGWHLQQRPELSIATLLERLKGKRLAAKVLMRTHPEMTAGLGVAAAFEVSWEPLSEAAKVLAGLLGLFAAAPIVWEWVAAAWAQAGTALDEEDLEEAQAELLRVNLLQRVEEPQKALRYRVHPLVREFFAVKRGEIAGDEGLQQGFAVAMTALAKTIPQVATVAVRTQVAEAVPHFEEVALQWTAVLEGIDKLWCDNGLGRFYESLSQWEDAERCYQRMVEISKAELGDRHPDTATSLNNLAELYQSQGRY